VSKTLLRIFFLCLFQWKGIAISLAQGQLFELLTAKQTGIDFSNTISETEGLNVLAYEYFFNGGGVAVGDLDKDGLADLFFTANMGSNKLFKNMGGLQFKDVTSAASKELQGRDGDWKTGVTMADVNNDGLLDIHICYSGKVDADRRRNQLFINLGGMKFREAAKEFGLDDPSYSNQAAFFDFDRDGDLDMFLLNHSIKKVDNLEFVKYRNQVDSFAGCKMYENRGNHFVDISEKVGISRSGLTFGLGLVVSDVNKDGWPDLYVTNDYNEPDHLYINTGKGSFEDRADQALSHMSQFSMGADIADYNNDALPDIVTLDMMPEDNRRQKLLQLQENYEIFELMQQQGLHKQYMRNMLHLNNGDNTFTEIGQLAGIAQTDWSWTPLFADFDNDGYKDLFITNGYLRDYTNKDFLKYWGDYKVKKAIDREPVQLMELIRAMPSTKVPNYIFHNEQDLTFSNKQKEWGFERPVISSGAVYADLDNDGDLELVINNVNEEAFLYKNRARESIRHHYIDLNIEDQHSAPAMGAQVSLFCGKQIQYQEVGNSKGYLCAVSSVLHFGLGSLQQVDSILILWPDGKKLKMANPPIDRSLSVSYPSELNRYTKESSEIKPVFRPIESPVNYRHQGFGENDFKRQLLMLFMYSNTGPVITDADINRDGRTDLFFSGNAQEPGRIYMQQQDGSFQKLDDLAIVNEEDAAVSAAAFTDVNNDGWPDLYVAKGGYSIWMPNSSALQDEIFINDGQGRLVKADGSLPDVSSSSKSCVRPQDYDGDGDMDLFIGGRIIPGRYPVSPESFLLVNDGRGRFSKTRIPFDRLGMITDAQWHDFNGDQRPDIILCGEMMALSVYLNTADGFENATDTYLPEKIKGFWSAIILDDLNGDAKTDLLATNLGKNVPFRVSPQQPATLLYADFDNNGSIDPFFNFFIQGSSYPYVSRDELNEQMVVMRRKFLSYASYADAKMEDIFSKEELQKAIELQADEQETVLLFQEEGAFKKRGLLPVQAQFSYQKKILTDDFNGDGFKDILLFGNQTPNRLKMGAIQANRGTLLLGNGKGDFTFAEQPLCGLNLNGDIKSAIRIKVSDKKTILVGASDQPVQAYVYE